MLVSDSHVSWQSRDNIKHNIKVRDSNLSPVKPVGINSYRWTPHHLEKFLAHPQLLQLKIILTLLK